MKRSKSILKKMCLLSSVEHSYYHQLFGKSHTEFSLIVSLIVRRVQVN